MAKKPKVAKATGETPSFEAMLAKLERVVDDLEEGQLGLSESLERYEEGIKHLKKCYELLQRAERRIELLSGVDAEGNPAAEPFDEQEMTLDEKQQSRSRRRTRPERRPAPPEAGEDGVDTPGGLF